MGYDQEKIKAPLLLELIYLSVEEPNAREQGLLIFREKCPILFSGLHAIFGIMPSVSQICEQMHIIMQDSLKVGVSMHFNDARQSYIVDSVYYFCKARTTINQLKKVKDGSRLTSKKENTRVSTKHDNSKVLQQMEGEQLLKSRTVYTAYAIGSLPSIVKAKIAVSKIRAIRSLEIDKK